MKNKMYGICGTCDKWGDAPSEFNETKHFLVCGACGGDMFTYRSDPREAAYREKDKVNVTTIKQTEVVWWSL